MRLGEVVQILSPRDGFSLDAWGEPPGEARRGGLVILHAIWGVTPHLRRLAADYAELGYEVLVPSLFDRFHKGFPEADTDLAIQTRQHGFAEQSGWGLEALADVQAAIDALAPPVFLVGFCYGGTAAWLAAARCSGLTAVSSFYGGQIGLFLEEMPKVPTELHLGHHDELIPPSDVEAIRTHHPDVPVFVYDAGHAFVAPSGFHADSARLARLRTLKLFARSGGGRGEGA